MLTMNLKSAGLNKMLHNFLSGSFSTRISFLHQFLDANIFKDIDDIFPNRTGSGITEKQRNQ